MSFIPYLSYIWNEDLLWLLSSCIQHFKFITKVTKQTWTYSIHICTDELQEKAKIMSIPRTAQDKEIMPRTGPRWRPAGLILPWKLSCSQATDYIAQHWWKTLNPYEHFWAQSQHRSNSTTQWNTAISTSLTFSLSTSFCLSTFFQNHFQLTVKTLSLTRLFF